MYEWNVSYLIFCLSTIHIPIDTICNLVILTDNIILGVHCYMGVNSYISNTYVQKTESNFIKLGVWNER